MTSQKETVGEEALELVHRDDLTTFVVTAARAGDVRRRRAATLGADVKLLGTPALAGTADALFHFGGATFWDCHIKSWLGGAFCLQMRESQRGISPDSLNSFQYTQ